MTHSNFRDCACDLALHRIGCPLHVRCRNCGHVCSRRADSCPSCRTDRPRDDTRWRDIHMVTVGGSIAAALAKRGEAALLTPIDTNPDAAIAFAYEIASDVLTANALDSTALLRERYDALLERVRRILEHFAEPPTRNAN